MILPPAFLFETLTGKTGGGGLEEGADPSATGRTIRTTDQNWFKHAIANFLGGRYLPALESAANAAQDDRVRFIMPTVDIAPDGTVVLNVTTALAQKPQDALDTKFNEQDLLPGPREPLHPRNGLIPSREVHRRLRPHMVPDATAVPLMDAILAEWPAAPRFFPIRFTRTCEPVANCSVFFPKQNGQHPHGAGSDGSGTASGSRHRLRAQEPPPIGSRYQHRRSSRAP